MEKWERELTAKRERTGPNKLMTMKKGKAELGRGGVFWYRERPLGGDNI